MTSLADEIVAQRPRLRIGALRFTRQSDRAEDLLQDTICRALEKQHQFKPGTNLLAWMWTIMRNIYLVQLRRAGRVVEDPDGIMANHLAVAGGQESSIDVQDFLSAYARLSPEHQEILFLGGLLQLTYEEIADKLGLKVGTAKSRLSRARSQLRELLDDPDYGPTPIEIGILANDHIRQSHR